MNTKNVMVTMPIEELDRLREIERTYSLIISKSYSNKASTPGNIVAAIADGFEYGKTHPEAYTHAVAGRIFEQKFVIQSQEEHNNG